MNDDADKLNAQSHPSAAPGNWYIRIFTPEESEKMLREEPRVSAWEVLDRLKQKYGAEKRDG